MLLARGGGDPVAALVGLALVAIAFLIAWLLDDGSFSLGSVRYRTRTEFLDDFGAAIGLRGRAVEGGQGPAGGEFAGDVGGIATRLSFTREKAGKHSFLRVTVTARADDVPALRVTREGLFTGVGRWLGVTNDHVVGDERFDERYVLDTHDPRAKKALENRELRRAVDAVFRKSEVTTLELARGSVRAVADRVGGWDPQDFRALVDEVGSVALAFVRVPVKVRVLGRERRAFRGRTRVARCAYCHVDVSGDEPDLVACDRCATVAHDACWTELGRCPVLGCDGASRERSAERA